MATMMAIPETDTAAAAAGGVAKSTRKRAAAVAIIIATLEATVEAAVGAQAPADPDRGNEAVIKRTGKSTPASIDPRIERSDVIIRKAKSTKRNLAVATNDPKTEIATNERTTTIRHPTPPPPSRTTSAKSSKKTPSKPLPPSPAGPEARPSSANTA